MPCGMTKEYIRKRINARYRKMKVRDDRRWSTYIRWAETGGDYLETEYCGFPADVNPRDLKNSYRLAKNFIRELDKCE